MGVGFPFSFRQDASHMERTAQGVLVPPAGGHRAVQRIQPLKRWQVVGGAEDDVSRMAVVVVELRRQGPMKEVG